MIEKQIIKQIDKEQSLPYMEENKIEIEKTCCDCQKMKNTYFFYKNKNVNGGFERYCKDCAKMRTIRYPRKPESIAKAQIKFGQKKIQERSKKIQIKKEYRALFDEIDKKIKEKNKEINKKAKETEKLRILESDTKECSNCKIIKNFNCFYNSKKTKIGLESACKQCSRKRKIIYKINNLEHFKENAKKSREKNKDKTKEFHKKYFKENKELYRKRGANWRAKNPERAKELGRIHFQTPSRKEKHRINQAKRRAKKFKATLPGFEERIFKIYSNCPKGMEVDHIVPLRGKTVSGLHTPWNMQYLSKEDNFKKNNKLLNNCMEIKSAEDLYEY